MGPREGPGPKGVLAGPGTPRDPKSHLFVTKWVAIRPFCVFLRPVCTEFCSRARQIGLPPSISTLFHHFFDQKMPKSGHVFERTGSSPGGLGNSAPWGPKGARGGPWGAISAPNGAPGAPFGALWGPRDPMVTWKPSIAGHLTWGGPGGPGAPVALWDSP